MNGVHDMGGMHGLGAVAPEADEPVFHHDWEARVHAMNLASPTRGNIDAGRHKLELIPAADYLRMSYYEKWLTRLEGLLLAGGYVTADAVGGGSGRRGTAAPSGAAAGAVPPAASGDVRSLAASNAARRDNFSDSVTQAQTAAAQGGFELAG